MLYMYLKNNSVGAIQEIFVKTLLFITNFFQIILPVLIL